ncbi:MAG: type II toxin-antitoxin system VapC family toxin [Rhodoferax sp.]|nr:type II toxin-antitoxin system VapC family toxin [Rhodoferax sp.]MCL4737175.1 type II toxin-antitoxin system VapC family toxin [Burkholderiaceae bacterium]MCP5290324.1 type II toxin-antitoxin system VapC family toxin [Burkholderiaceae bacterium]HMQ71866.1 type II toxin-antitoxin system VapC family toxin [Rubrivivax sp.]
MRSLDTNILARLLVDDPDDAQAAAQRPAAIAALSTRAFVTVTVLLELEWVLRGFYGLPRAEIVRGLRALAGIPQLTIEDRDAVLTALEACAGGMDFADALHVARSGGASGFATFDRALATKAGRAKLPVAVELLR